MSQTRRARMKAKVEGTIEHLKAQLEHQRVHMRPVLVGRAMQAEDKQRVAEGITARTVEAMENVKAAALKEKELSQDAIKTKDEVLQTLLAEREKAETERIELLLTIERLQTQALSAKDKQAVLEATA